MGNAIDRDEMCGESTNLTLIEPHMDEVGMQDEEKENHEPQSQQQQESEPEVNPSANLMFHLYSYRQQLSCKKHHVIKMATSKLLLTEELLKLQPIKHKISTNLATSWEDHYEIPLLSDDELDDNDEEPANNDPLAAELTNLKNYRKELRSIIVDVATEKLKKSTKKKLKRLKRRTLISSKKPSKKNKHRTQYDNWEQNLQEPQHEQAQEESPDVIVID